MTPFNELSPAEAERLALLAEECGEVIHVIGKILRHGYESRHPTDPDCQTNRQMLEREIGDLMFAADLLAEHDIIPGNIVRATASKRERVWRYLHNTRTIEDGEDHG